ncbi:VOC family protein [Parvularcula marina]|uniref:VOC family protein n=1 Tax=Parvularcula marina TaxID=2292771 RepID=A0A371RHT8_9PROT|nr:VOC family protein [Parvularcula marina]RFB05024.1 VOC family protein [Parvularcula marina]
MKLNQVTVTVDNMDAAIAFYERLGMTLIVHTHERYARFELPGGETFSLHLGDRPGTDGPALYFEVENVDTEYDRLRRAGIEFDTEPVTQSWLWREAWFSDPAGNRLCLYRAGENRRFPPWRKKG